MKVEYRCPQPEKSRLAIFSPEATLAKYQDEFNDASAYWQSELKRARLASNSALADMAKGLVGFIVDFKIEWESSTSFPSKERARMALLSTLGISAMLRHAWNDDTTISPELVGPNRELGTINDWVVGFPSDWQDFRVHTPIAAPDALAPDRKTQWYKQEGFWVKQQRPVRPTNYLMGTFLPRLGYTRADLARHETLFPYIEAR